MAANTPDCGIVIFFRGLMASKALRGVEILPGSNELPAMTGPNRIVIFPDSGDFIEAGDVTANIVDVNQNWRAELWGKGTSTKAGSPVEARLADWNAAWLLVVKLLQAESEQARNPNDPINPGVYWTTTGGPEFSLANDTNEQGTCITMRGLVRVAIPAADGDVGHEGDNWSQGTVNSTSIDGLPSS